MKRDKAKPKPKNVIGAGCSFSGANAARRSVQAVKKAAKNPNEIAASRTGRSIFGIKAAIPAPFGIGDSCSVRGL
jgi:hypothetical protein